jgi:membrane associated rhomboid family serine protease
MTQLQRFALLLFIGGELWVVIDVAGTGAPSPIAYIASVVGIIGGALFVRESKGRIG